MIIARCTSTNRRSAIASKKWSVRADCSPPNTVTIAGQAYVKKGTACREADGSWTVSAAKAG